MKSSRPPVCKKDFISLSPDVYSSGQVESKLWLCRELEKILHNKAPQTVWVLAGWAGLLSFLLLSRERLSIQSICSFDTEPHCEKLALTINENWVWKGPVFKAKSMDVNHLNYKDLSIAKSPSVIINTAVEHFDSKQWYNNIPKGKIVALQSCDMQHKEHVRCSYSEKEFQEQFPAQKLYYSGSLKFDYPEWSFTRYMLIFKK